MAQPTIQFQKAVKTQEKARIALDGPAGGGKTWTALTVGCWMAEKEGGRCVVIDSERSSALKYASDFDFDHATLPDYSPNTYIDTIKAAIAAGYKVIIVDSLSHAWEGTLEMKDRVTAASVSKNSFDAWRKVTPVHNDLIDLMLRAPAHVIVTMRTHTEYIIEQDERGRSKPVKVGLKPVQRGGVEYEFDIVGDMDWENSFVVTKTRCSALAGAMIRRPGIELAQTIWDWLNDGIAVATREQLAELADVIRTSPEREAVSEAWKVRYGQATRLPATQFQEALDYARMLVGDPAPAPATEPLPEPLPPESPGKATPASTTTPSSPNAPSPGQIEALNGLMAVMTPEGAHGVREELKARFGLPSSYTAAIMGEVIETAEALVKAWGEKALQTNDAEPPPPDPEGAGQKNRKKTQATESPAASLVEQLNACGQAALKDFITWRQQAKKNAPETPEEIAQVKEIIKRHEKGAA